MRQRLKNRASKLEYVYTDVVETLDITEIEHLAVFIGVCDCDFYVYGELVELIPRHGTIRSQDIF